MSDILMAIMPHAHYEGACNAVREVTGKTEKIRSGDFEAEVRAALSMGGGNSQINYSEGLLLGRSDVAGLSGFEVDGIGACTDTDIVIPRAHNGQPIVSIDITAFLSNTDITSAVIPASVQKIGYSAFNGCSNLKSVTICNPSVEIGTLSGIAGMYTLFGNCNSLTDIYVPWSEGAVVGAPWGAPNATIHYDADVSRYDFVDYEATIKELQGKLASLFERSLTSLTANDFAGATRIGAYAFGNYSTLQKIELPNTIESIGLYAFNNCTSIETVTLPDSLSILNTCAFYNCSKLKKITFGACISSIGPQVFNKCSAVEEYDFSACTKIPTLSNANAFGSISDTCIIKIPSVLFDEWSTGTNWSTLVAYMVVS